MDSYDLWDLGEFDQKGGKRTKWGTKEELLGAIKVAADKGIITYIDAVLNHKYVLTRPWTAKLIRSELVRTTRRSSWPLWSIKIIEQKQSERRTTLRDGRSR